MSYIRSQLRYILTHTPVAAAMPAYAARKVLNRKPQNTRTERGRNKDDMLPETRALLDNFYGKYNMMLAELLGDERLLWKDAL